MSHTIETEGDEQSLKCPLCEYDHCFQDWVCEGWSGDDEYQCEGCGEPLEIEVECVAVWDLTARAEKPEARKV